MFIGIIVILIVAAGGYFAWMQFFQEKPVETPEPQTQEPVVQDSMYASSTMKFSLKYPQGFTLEEPYAYTRVSPTKPISGVKFRAPLAMTQGTNLAADSGVSVEQLPRAQNCSGDIFLKANVRSQTQTSGALTFSVASSSETVGSDTYEETVFAVPGSSPCIAMRYFLHSTSAGTSTASTTRAFDRAAVIAEFDKIRQSMSVQ